MQIAEEIISIHTHITPHDLIDAEISFGRYGVSPKMVDIFVDLYKAIGIGAIKHIEDILEEVYGKDINIAEFARNFFTSIENAEERLIKDMDEAGISKAVVLDVLTSDYEIKHSDRLIRFTSEYYMRDLMKKNDGDYGPVPVGIKSYPKMRGIPTDEILEMAQDFKVPIVAHCSKGGIHGNQTAAASNKLASPAQWAIALEKYPGLIVCLAHAGGCTDFVNYWTDGTSGWMKDIYTLMTTYPFVYVDVSYHDMAVHNPDRYFSALKKAIHSEIGNRIMFGDDRPFMLVEYNLKQWVDSFKEHLTIGEWNIICNKNPKVFLKGLL